MKIKMNINKEKISNFILASKYHSIDQIIFEEKNGKEIQIINDNLNKDFIEEIKLFLDLDMHIFAEDFEKYSENQKKIRLEFSLYNDEEWRLGRLDFLGRLLKRKRIYYTEYFFENYEKIARENIRKDMEILESNRERKEIKV